MKSIERSELGPRVPRGGGGHPGGRVCGWDAQVKLFMLLCIVLASAVFTHIHDTHPYVSGFFGGVCVALAYLLGACK